MKSCTRTGLIVAVTLPLLLVSGCTGSDVISTGNAAVVVQAPVTNPSDRFDFLHEMQVVTIDIRPTDPETAASVVGPIGLFSQSASILVIDFNVAGSDDPTDIVLSGGQYQIVNLTLKDIFLVGRTPTTWTECNEGTRWVESLITYTGTDLGDLGLFTVPQGGSATLNIGFDSQAFIEDFTNSWTCFPGPNGPRPVDFDRTGFKALAPNYLTISTTSLN